MKLPKETGKTVLILFVLIISIAILFSGCGSNNETDATPDDTNGGQTESPDQSSDDENDHGVDDADEIDKDGLISLFNAGRELNEFSYEMKTTAFDLEEFATRFWIKDEKIRTESEVEGKTYIIIMNKEHYYTLDPETKIAMKIPLEDDSESVELGDYIDDVDDESLNYVGTEELNGISCYLVQTSDESSGYEMKMWLHKDYGFPMKIETISEETDEIYTMEVTNFSVGNVSDDMFEVPAEYQITDIEDMFENFPDMIEDSDE
ncbi:DUF4412 domain-containing protein [Alkalibacter mobilis]|uniref:DUF4412 domain-containing protein n=1 Tax=Alkalibacter mobilis TaxID=2787712 RepID=UPI00189D75A3|nr:DUF4412 domain-containing protein [Alkalibacter mobilis]MBF7097015.1 DUF4412 domain-containing protein [Alkalibacter mobilis]